MMMNASFGFDILNEEKYTKTKLCDYTETMEAQRRANFMHTRIINNNLNIVTYRSGFYKCNTCIQEGVFTMDNAKYAYCSFVYDFMYRCLDMSKIHFSEGDTDSSYWAISGDPTKGIHQGFRYVVKDRGFYHKHYYEWFPNYTKGISDVKKLGGVAIEKEGDEMIAIAAKNYYIRTSEKDVMKCKGVSMEKNKNITSQQFINVIKENEIVTAVNRDLQLKKLDKKDKVDVMVKNMVEKVAISGVHTKMIVLENQSCAPYIQGFTADDYVCQ
jgi:hypothetical protein